MPPIPVYANALFRAEGVTPITAAEAVEPQLEPTRTTETTTSALYQPSCPPPPQPGARPAAPTDTNRSFCDPPGLQPGEAPHVHHLHRHHPHRHHPHRITEIHTKTTTAWQQPSQTPAQFSLPTPLKNYSSMHSTTTGDLQPSPYETGRADFNGERIRRSLEHPPGYVQNPYAADGTAQDRERFEHASRQASEEEGMLGTVKTYFGGAGSALKKVEESAWDFAKGLGK